MRATPKLHFTDIIKILGRNFFQKQHFLKNYLFFWHHCVDFFWRSIFWRHVGKKTKTNVPTLKNKNKKNFQGRLAERIKRGEDTWLSAKKKAKSFWLILRKNKVAPSLKLALAIESPILDMIKNKIQNNRIWYFSMRR